MLVSFTARNFRSLRDEVTLDLRTPRGSGVRASPWSGDLQAVAGIYGANASGKTAVFRAIWTMAMQVRNSYRSPGLLVDPFIFDYVCRDRPTELSAMFIADDGVCYAYGFSTVNGLVVKEWAERYQTARPTLLFDRRASTVKFGAALNGPNRAVEKTVGASSLFLSAAAAAGHAGLAPLYRWFREGLRLFPAHGHESFLSHVIATLAQDDDRRDRMVTMLARADLGMDGLVLQAREPTNAEQALAERVSEFVRALSEGEPPDSAPGKVYTAFGTHTAGGHLYSLPFDEESEGTRAMLCHAFVLDEALRTGATAVFDEVDTSLHPLLVRELVHTFQDPELNPRQAQLVFTTHDVSLLDAGHDAGSALSRDEVWITERDDEGVSRLTALADYAPRTRENLARRYLSGRFGGIPQPTDLIDPALF
ncbi:MAG: AAA family ATPase [Bifidobacteriaceae bacterium]|nr:AAA family ATPase [Bifidobacteriaceae bacterium]